MDIIRVAATSRSTAVAGAIAGVMRERGQVDVQAIGAGAVNQAVKAVTIARGYLEMDEIDIVCVPSFVEVMIDDQERTAVRLSVEKRPTPVDRVTPTGEERYAPSAQDEAPAAGAPETEMPETDEDRHARFF
jgi:stage V sporulation protein S